MKKIKKTFKKIPKKLIACMMLFVMVFTCITPLTKVLANNTYGEGEHSINLDIRNDEGFTIEDVTINSYPWNSAADEYHSNNNQYHITISVSGNETTGDKVPRVGWGGNWNGEDGNITSSVHTTDSGYEFALDLTVTSTTQTFIGLFIEEKMEEAEPGPEPGEGFDGKAYLIWSCTNGGICYHHYDNIPNFDDGNSYFIKESTVTADNEPGQIFSVNAEYKGWSTDSKFDNWVAAYKTHKGIPQNENIDWSKVDPKDMIGEPIDVRQYEAQAESTGACTKNNTPQDEFEACVNNYAASQGILIARAQLQPVGEPTGNNAYVSYGDRNFKIVVYNDNYKGVTIGDLSDLNYYPSEWANPFLRQDQFDLSGTTKDKPTTINTILLENTINIKTLNYNGFSINQIESLDVPENAVSISKVNGEWKLVFSSNFYDNVVFKVTDSNGEVSYFNVKRYTVDAWINNIENEPHLYAELYFDKNKFYSDFDLTAKIEYKDGTTENVVLTVYNKIDDGLGNITTAYEVDESASPDPEHIPSGKGLKKSVFIYKLPNGKTDRDIKKAYVNVEYKGSTEENYAGAFAGSGKGILANIYQEEEE